MRVPLSLALSLLLLLPAVGGCSRDPEPASAPAAPAGRLNPYLRLVPADTPYFLITEERPSLDVMLAHLARQHFDKHALLLEVDPEAEGLSDEERSARAAVRRIFELLPERLDQAALAELGLRPDAHLAFYGVDLLPAFRMELADRDRFLAFLDRLWQALELAPERGEREGRLWLRAPAGPLTIHLTLDRDLHFALAPSEIEESDLARMLGETPPAQSLADTNVLAELKARHGFQPVQLGRLSSSGILEALRKNGSSAPGGEPTTLAKPECAEEFAALGRRFPGLEFGFRAFTRDQLELGFVFLLEPALAQSLTPLVPRLPPPGTSALAEVGFGLRLAEVPALLSGWAQALEQAPYRCDALLALNDLAKGFREGAANPALGIASMTGEGVLVSLERLDLDRAPQYDFEASVLLVSENPTSVLALAGSLAPDLHRLGLVAGGEAKPLPAGMLMAPVERGFAALGERAIAVGLNHRDGRRVEAAVKQLPQVDGVILRLGWRGELLRMIAQFIEKESGDSTEAKTLVRQLRDMGNDLDEISLDLRIKPVGIEYNLKARFAPLPASR